MCQSNGSEASSNSARSGQAFAATAGPTVPPDVPLASPVDLTFDTEAPLPGPGTSAAGATMSDASVSGLIPIPPFKFCRLDFRDGCYAMTFRPAGIFLRTFRGTLRVDRAAPDGGPDRIIVSGDLYKESLVIDPMTLVVAGGASSPTPAPGTTRDRAAHANISGASDAATETVAPSGTRAASTTAAAPVSLAAAVSRSEAPVLPLPSLVPQIPIFARARYHSYLRVTSVSAPIIVPAHVPCQVTLLAEEFLYTQPPAGQHKGSFPAAPSRTVTIKLTKLPAPFPFSLTGGPYFEGTLFEGGADKGQISLAWVSPFFRRATLEIDTLTGAVAPAPVPDGAGGTEFFDTIFAKIGWQLRVVRDQTNVPVPAGVNPTNCWSSGDLHNLMTTVRNPGTNLDAEWRVHLMVVPAKLGCARGVMYDQIGVPREGCASFSDDGYPTSDSSNFGAAANQKQRDVPRAFLRSATHEVTHTFNQIHQEIETSADNSIMTTTPSVADVLGGPATGEPGVFPDQINLGHNATVRHHLNHMPDPVIRPGGWPFSSWFPSGAPQASDRHAFAPTELELAVTCAQDRVALGQPVELSWTLTNRSGVALQAPNDVSVEALFTTITVTDGLGRAHAVRPFVILCDTAKLIALAPGETVSASHRVFWSSEGFAFERPGRYRLTVSVNWSGHGVPVGVAGGVDLFVDYPANDADNHAAGLVLHPDVGKWVALGGGAYHLAEACRRLYDLSKTAGSDAEPKLLQGFAGLLPDRERLGQVYPDMMDETRERSTRRPRRPRPS
jgi:hypothetical protein